MRKTILMLMLGAAAISAKSQTVLTNETHGFIPNERNPMLLANYVEPGSSGKNVVWDFSNLEVNNTFVGLIHDTFVSKCSSLFPNGNTVLEEFGNYFIFEASNSSLEQYGLLTATGQTQILYTKPFVKMRYPFTFGSSFSGNFKGDYISNGKVIGQVEGSYSIDGDAKGILKLANGKELENTLRVKEVKLTKQTINNASTQIEDVTYRWYVSNHRFPVLVLIKSTYTSPSGVISSGTKAAFNSDVVSLASNANKLAEELRLDIYPNPYRGKVKIAYRLDKNSTVNISVYDITGKLVQVIVNGDENEGTQAHYFSAVEQGMSAGAYIVKLTVNGNEVSRKILEVK